MDDYITKAQIDLAYSQSWRTGVNNSLAITVLGVANWGEFETRFVIGWLVYGYIVSLGRSLLFYFIEKKTRFLRSSKNKKWVLFVSMFLSSLVWASAAVLFVDVNNMDAMILTLLSVVGMVAIGMPALVIYKPIFFVFALPPLATISLVMYQMGFLGPALLALACLIGMPIIGNNLNNFITKSITLDHKNAELLEHVSRAKDEAVEARDEAERANRSKSEFLAAASHDLRQPLHSMGLFIESLLNRWKDDNGENREILENISRSHSALSRLFDSLLEISRLDAGSVKANVIDLSLREHIAAICDEFQPSASAKGLVLACQCDDVAVSSDPVLLSRIMRNLINNAIKFTDNGCVIVYTQQLENDIVLTVMDTGVGIPESEHEKIFSEYHQLKNPERDRNKGIGLGLSVVKRMSDLLGHQFTLESSIGKGSRFSLQLELGSYSSLRDDEVLEWDTVLPDYRVLVIDDEITVLDAMKLTLNDLGCTAVLAESIEEALHKLSDDGENPDILISDYRLRNNTTGLDVINEVRKQLGRDIPAILVSGDTDPDLLKTIREQGYFLLHKPLKASHLQVAIQQLMTGAEEQKQKQACVERGSV